jgi:hypothetical protein
LRRAEQRRGADQVFNPAAGSGMDAASRPSRRAPGLPRGWLCQKLAARFDVTTLLCAFA